MSLAGSYAAVAMLGLLGDGFGKMGDVIQPATEAMGKLGENLTKNMSEEDKAAIERAVQKRERKLAKVATKS